MRVLLFAAALAATSAVAPARDKPAEHMSAAQRATYQAWPTDQRAAFDGWPLAVRGYYWTLSAEQQAGFWRLSDDQRAMVVAMTPQQRLRAWDTILLPSRANVMAALARN